MSPSRNRNAIRVTGIPAWLALVVAGYRLFLIFAASSVCASANVRTIADANAASALGVGLGDRGFLGPNHHDQTGTVGGWCRSTLSVSPERLRAPLADLVPVAGPMLRRLYLDSANWQDAGTGELIGKVAQDGPGPSA